MRDPKRIKKFCDELAEIWETKCPDWRFGQLMCNTLASDGHDPFFDEDDKMMEKLEKYFGIRG